MQQPMDSCVCGINRAQKVFSLGHIYFSRDKHVPVNEMFLYAKCKSDKTRELSDLKFIPQT